MRDPYEVLGVARDADEKEVNRAYRTLAKEHHPDTKPGSEERFKEIAAAYDVLSHPEARAAYDAASRSSRPVDAVVRVDPSLARDGGRVTLRVSVDGRTERRTVRIPAGVRDGSRLRIPGGKRGIDLVGRVEIVWPEGERDVEGTIRVRLTDALFGGEFTVDVGARRRHLRLAPLDHVPANVRFPRAGRPGNPPGDVLSTIEVALPDLGRLDEADRQTLRRLLERAEGRGG